MGTLPPLIAVARPLATVLGTILEGDLDRRLGGAVKVPERRRIALGEAAHQLPRQRLAAREDAAERGAGLDARRGDEGLQHRRHEVDVGDPLLGDEAGEIGRILVASRAGEDQPRPGEERPEELPDRDVEGDRRLLQHPILARQAERLLRPEQPVDDGAMAVHRPLGPTRRARGVDHVGEVVGIGCREPRAGPVRPRGEECFEVDLDDRRDRRDRRTLPRQGARRVAVGEEHTDRGVLDHVGQPLDGVRRVERHVGGTRGEDGDEPDHQPERALGAEAHEDAGSDPFASELPRQPLRRVAELPIGELVARQRDRDRAGRALDPRRD